MNSPVMPKGSRLSGKEYYTYARLCKRVYARAFHHGVLGYDTHRMFRNHRGDQRAAVLSNDREITVVFRGTKYLYDWWSNLAFFPQKLKADDRQSPWVHSGFNTILDRPDSKLGRPLLDCISDCVKKLLEEKKRRVILTGHSLGGALAVLSAARFDDTVKEAVEGVVTFGQPAVGFRDFARRQYPFHDSTFRVCSGIDAVTFMPPALYRHVGHQYWIHDGQVWEGVPWYERILRTMVLAATMVVRDHGMEKYIKHEEYWKPPQKDERK